MHIKNIFRIIIILSILIPVTGGVYTFLSIENYSQDWQDLIAWNGDGSILDYSEESSTQEMLYIGFLVTVTILFVASTIGLFLFKKWARTLTVTLSLFGLLLTLFMGLTVMAPIEAISYDISTFLCGVIITMAYLSPLKERFEET